MLSTLLHILIGSLYRAMITDTLNRVQSSFWGGDIFVIQLNSSSIIKISLLPGTLMKAVDECFQISLDTLKMLQKTTHDLCKNRYSYAFFVCYIGCRFSAKISKDYYFLKEILLLSKYIFTLA